MLRISVRPMVAEESVWCLFYVVESIINIQENYQKQQYRDSDKITGLRLDKYSKGVEFPGRKWSADICCTGT
jgi:hypothetical protein